MDLHLLAPHHLDLAVITLQRHHSWFHITQDDPSYNWMQMGPRINLISPKFLQITLR